MQRKIFPLALAALLLSGTSFVRAQDAAAAALARQAEEEQYRSLSTRVMNLEESNQSLQRKVQDLTEALHKLKDEVARSANNKEVAAMQESIRRLEAAIKEVDEKRIADNSKVLAALENIKQAIASRPAPHVSGGNSSSGGARTPNPPSRGESGRNTNSGGGNATEEGYNYSIKANDTLSGLVSALRSQGIKVTQKQIMDANPNVNWNRLKVGQTVFIPKPPE
jgi:TolA-binding protein